ncbi:unnamed protein product [Caenorhabditis angaria]|uniref:SAND domain-containing protein n=1 Tax=Caenorhabditis angaria TaxID=860376 RepID=A0A9P1IEM5_9PELO|nr:unnamed protein product [Caenorhabditis angaria]
MSGESVVNQNAIIQESEEASMNLYSESKIVYQIMYPITNEAQIYTRPVVPIQIPIPDDPSAQTIPVSCGNVIGKMHLQLFICPGIHQPCIEHGNELLTPKQFTVRADKAKQKDWKASIRIGKSSLRVHMEAHTIDFHDHANCCSGKCQSRNYVNNMHEKAEEIEFKKAKRSAESIQLRNELQVLSGNGDSQISENVNMDEQIDVPGVPDSSAVLREKKNRGRPRGSVNKSRIKVEKVTEQIFNNLPVDDVLLGTSLSEIQNAPTPAGCTPFSDIMECLKNDPKHFWEQMHSTGVISHFCDDIIVSAINLKQAILTQSELNTNTANSLTRSAFSFGIQSMIVQRVQAIEKSVVQQQKHREMLIDMMQSNHNNNNTGCSTESSYPTDSQESSSCAPPESTMHNDLIENVKTENSP